jgi:RsiW-degrading membrane proteinase PrsW (M82 family)
LVRLLVVIPLLLLPLGLSVAIFRRTSKLARVSRRLALAMGLGGVVGGVVALLVEGAVLDATELTFRVSQSGLAGALLATFLLAAPLEEALKLLPIWMLYRARRIGNPQVGLTYAAACAAGFAASESVLTLATEGTEGGTLLRLALSVPAHLFFAGAWGYALGAGRTVRGRWFSITWLVAMLLHGLFDHILWGRGVGQSVALVPLLLFMALATWLALRRGAVEVAGHSLFPEPSIESVRAVLRAGDQPLMLRWIVYGALVTLGLMLVLVALAVVLGRRMGVDFALADQTDVRAAGPLMLLGAAVLLAFPIAGYLIARASATQSLLEPMLAAALTVALLVALLALAAPIGVLFAVAVAPIALGLACAGAWVGLER